MSTQKIAELKAEFEKLDAVVKAGENNN